MTKSGLRTTAIVGAGLVLARTLQMHGFASTAYELDATAHARRQDY